MSTDLEDLVKEFLWAPKRPVVLIDERRFGPAQGFKGERAVWASVLTRSDVLTDFGLEVEAIRATLDPQKRGRALKSADVMEGRLARQLRCAVERAYARSQVGFWSSASPYLLQERRLRERAAATDVNSGRDINGPETPLVDMIGGRIAETSDIVRQIGCLDMVVDRSQQNGLHEDSPMSFTVYDLPLDGAPAIQGGKTIRLGAGIRRRMFAVCERTPVFGDWLILPDLAAHLWGRSPVAIDRLREQRLLEAVEDIGAAPGANLNVELAKYPLPAVTDHKQR